MGSQGSVACPLVTIVCPVFSEERSVEPFYQRLSAAIESADTRIRFELLFINNRSADRTLQIIQCASGTQGAIS